MGYILFHCCVLLLRTWLTESTIIHKHRLLPRETRFWAEARLCSTALNLPWLYAACLGDDCYPCFRCTLKIPVHEGWSSGCSGLAAWMKKMSRVRPCSSCSMLQFELCFFIQRRTKFCRDRPFTWFRFVQPHFDSPISSLKIPTADDHRHVVSKESEVTRLARFLPRVTNNLTQNLGGVLHPRIISTRTVDIQYSPTNSRPL